MHKGVKTVRIEITTGNMYDLEEENDNKERLQENGWTSF